MYRRNGSKSTRLTNGVLISLLVSVPAIVALAQTPKQTKSFEQSHFDLEQAVTRPAGLPGSVLQTLRQDPTVLSSSCPRHDEPSDQMLASLFEASRLHLAGPGEIDLIVKAKDACLFGANIGPFWVFRNTPQGYKLVLSISALGIQVLPSRSHNCRDILAGAVAAGKAVNVTYKFDGKSYREFSTKVEEIH